ncbi:MAG: hypothetical protein ACKPKO_64535, partial [Candidatus Fonsibacter sp.]
LDAYSAAEAEVFGQVALITVTPDIALHLYIKAASRALPAMRLMKQKKAIAPIMDEFKRCPAATCIALASNIRTMVAVGDRGQELYDLHSYLVNRSEIYCDHTLPRLATLVGRGTQ